MYGMPMSRYFKMTLTHPKAAGLRDKPFIYYHKLSTIFGKDQASGFRAVDLGEEEVVSETEETTPTNFEDINVDMGVNPSPEIVGGKGTKRKRSKTDEFIHIYILAQVIHLITPSMPSGMR
ncbi:hypothetical protein Tco_1168174 [Tanacetum coccineum]